MSRELTFAKAIREAIDQSMERDPAVYVIGLGVPDPKGIFGTTSGLKERYGPRRVMDMPASENGMTGVALGSALVGMRPILTHQRIDFALLAMDQMVNQAAKWHYMFGGQAKAPMVIRMIIGRGWGQGPQHSQSLHAWFAHVPGLKVVMPATPYDAKGLMAASIEDNNPVIFLEHRWLYNISGPVPEELYSSPLGRARVIVEGSDVSLVASSYMTLEAVRAARLLAEEGVRAEVVDLRTVRPLDEAAVLSSVRKTGRILVADIGQKTGGLAGEVVALVAESLGPQLKAPPVRIAMPDHPVPTTPALANYCYPGVMEIVSAARRMLGVPDRSFGASLLPTGPRDIPDASFKGPF